MPENKHEPNANPDPTADYRKYPKGPNFLGIVIGACCFLLVFFIVVYFFLHHDANKIMPPPGEHRNNTPNSLLHPPHQLLFRSTRAQG